MNTRLLGERHLEITWNLLKENKEEDAFEHLTELDNVEFGALLNAAKKTVEEGDGGLTSLLQRVAVRRHNQEQMKAGQLIEEMMAFDTQEERDEWIALLTPEHRKMLNKELWKHKDAKDAIWHLLKRSVSPTPKRAVASAVAGGLGATGAVVSGAGTVPAIIMGVSSAIMVDVIITGFEEDEATRKFGQGLRSVFVDKPKNWLQRLATKEKDCDELV